MKLLSRVRLVVTPWTAAYQALPSRDFLGKSTGVACHCLLSRSLGDTVNLQIQTQEVHVGRGLASLGCSQVLPTAGGGPTYRVYRRGSSVCAGTFVIVLGLFRLLFCLSCTKGRAAGLQLFPVLVFIPLSPYHTARGVDTDLYMWKAPQ